MKKQVAVVLALIVSAVLFCSCGGSSPTTSQPQDTSAPSVILTSTATTPTNISPIAVTATFSEAVTGFAVGDITVTNGIAGSFAAVSATVYTFALTPSGQGTVTVSVAAGVAQDAAGNGNTVATAFSVSYDNVAPTVTLTSTATSPTRTSPIPVTATFSEAVTGFSMSDLTLTNGGASNFVAVSAAVYTFTITPGAPGTVTVNVAASMAQDLATNGSLASSQFSITFEIAAPPDPPAPPAIPALPPDGQFDTRSVNPRAEGDLEQVVFGTPGRDRIEQYGGTGHTLQYAEGGEAADWILQVGGDLGTDQTALAGDGNDRVHQYGGGGNCTQYADGGSGMSTYAQVGGQGTNVMEIHGGTGTATIEQYGGQGTNTMKLTGSLGDDVIKMFGGPVADGMDYVVSGGSDAVTINGGQGNDLLTIHKNQRSFTLKDHDGNIIFQSGAGGSTITVVNVEHLRIIGDDGSTIFQQG